MALDRVRTTSAKPAKATSAHRTDARRHQGVRGAAGEGPRPEALRDLDGTIAEITMASFMTVTLRRPTKQP
jgi:hypothetical protein